MTHDKAAPVGDGLPEPNYTQFPNIVLDSMGSYTGAEIKLLSVFVRQTFGWHRKQTPPLSISRLAALTGLHRSTVVETTQKLLEAGTLAEVEDTADGTIYRLRVSENPTSTTLEGVGKSDTYKETINKDTNTNVLATGGSADSGLPLRQRVIEKLRAINSPSFSLVTIEGKEGKARPQNETVKVIAYLWRLLWGEATIPAPAAMAKLISAFGGYKAGGAERLAVAMLNMAGRDIPAGPLNLLFTEAGKARKSAQIAKANEDSYIEVAPRRKPTPKAPPVVPDGADIEEWERLLADE